MTGTLAMGATAAANGHKHLGRATGCNLEHLGPGRKLKVAKVGKLQIWPPLGAQRRREKERRQRMQRWRECNSASEEPAARCDTQLDVSVALVALVMR